MNGEIYLNNGKYNIQGKIYNCEYDDFIKMHNNNIDINNEQLNEIKNNIIKSVESKKTKDGIFLYCINKKNELNKLIYSLKNNYLILILNKLLKMKLIILFR